MFHGQCEQRVTVLCNQGLVGSNNMLTGTKGCLNQFPGDSGAADQLNKFLLVREETELAEEGFVRVNFDPILKALLREVKYILVLDLDVPPTAQNLYTRVDIYRHQTGNLELIVEMYNDMLATLLPVEKPLLADRIEAMSKALQPGVNTLRWNSEGINPFIS